MMKCILKDQLFQTVAYLLTQLGAIYPYKEFLKTCKMSIILKPNTVKTFQQWGWHQKRSESRWQQRVIVFVDIRMRNAFRAGLFKCSVCWAKQKRDFVAICRVVKQNCHHIVSFGCWLSTETQYACNALAIAVVTWMQNITLMDDS